MTSSSSSAASSKSSPLLPPSDLLDWPPPLQPGAAPPKPGPELIGARTDGELLQALSLTASSAREPTFVLFGSSWCQHCHEMLGHFDAVARTAYQGFKEEEEGEEKPATLLGGPLAALRSALDRLSGKKGEGEDEDATVGGGGEEGDKSRRKNKSNGGGRGRFVAARVDFMSRAASHVRYTPTVSVYRGAGSKKRVVDGFHGGDAQRLADRAWLHLGGGRRRWGWC
jgi:hypothetical protein